METSLLDTVKEFEGTIKPGELHDILKSLKAIQEGGGNGMLKIEMRSDRVEDLSLKIIRTDKAKPTHAPLRTSFTPCLFMRRVWRRHLLEIRQRANWRKFEAIRR